MRKAAMKYRYSYIFLLVVILQGCGYANMTYFRKHQATIEDERRDWGLCGGNFFPDGKVRPALDAKTLECMNKKGYETINDYYVEQHIGFMNRQNPSKSYIESEILAACGFRWHQDGICQNEPYIFKDRLAAAVKCMSRNGFEATPPRYKHGFRIVDGLRPPESLFCTSLTPRNKKGGVSLGDWRLE